MHRQQLKSMSRQGKRYAGLSMQKVRMKLFFTRNATESLNLVAYSYGGMVLKPGDEILVSIMEHHSDMLPVEAGGRENRSGCKISGM